MCLPVGSSAGLEKNRAISLVGRRPMVAPVGPTTKLLPCSDEPSGQKHVMVQRLLAWLITGVIPPRLRDMLLLRFAPPPPAGVVVWGKR